MKLMRKELEEYREWVRDSYDKEWKTPDEEYLFEIAWNLLNHIDALEETPNA